jgi:DNA helicase HerA-like ATPase
MPESLETLLDALPSLDIGEALVVGDSVLLPSRIRISKPNQPPRSSTVDFWSEWSVECISPDLKQAVKNMRRQSRK